MMEFFKIFTIHFILKSESHFVHIAFHLCFEVLFSTVFCFHKVVHSSLQHASARVRSGIKLKEEDGRWPPNFENFPIRRAKAVVYCTSLQGNLLDPGPFVNYWY